MGIAVNTCLANALDDKGLRIMAAKARTGYYSDFDTPLPFPKIQLVQDLQAVGENELANQVINGEYDG